MSAEVPSFDQKDRADITRHLRTLATDNAAAGEIAQAVHWLNKILKKNNTSLGELADHPDRLLSGELSRKLGLYAAANRDLASQNEAIQTENQNLRQRVVLLEKIKINLRRVINPESNIYQSLILLSCLAIGPISGLVDLCVDKFYKKKVDVMGTLIISTAIGLAGHLMVNIGDWYWHKEKKKLALATAYENAANACSKKGDESKLCEAKYPESRGIVYQNIVFGWLAEYTPPGKIAYSVAQNKKPIIDTQDLLVGYNICRQATAYQVPAANSAVVKNNKYVLPAIYAKDEKESCNFQPVDQKSDQDSDKFNKFSMNKTVISPVMDQNGTYVGHQTCSQEFWYVSKGQKYQADALQPGWFNAQPYKQTDWACNVN